MTLQIPPAFLEPPAKLSAAWDKFIHNHENRAHAMRIYEGGSLISHLAHVWRFAEQSALRIAAQIDPLKPKDILDLGASAGGLSLALCTQFPNAKIYALEPEKEAYEVLCAMQKGTQQERLITMLGVGEKLDFPDASIDLIVCHQVLEHVHSPQQVMAEMWRVLRPGGMVHLELPNYLWPLETHVRSFFIPGLGKGAMKFFAKLQGLPADKIKFLDHLQLVTKPKLENWARTIGFNYYNFVADKLFGQKESVANFIHSNRIRRALKLLGNNLLSRALLKTIIAVGFYPTLLYKLEKPLN
jgi:ubiquinone/menaquinone biosynthesis C-methylase UbiE